jgi:hypothetical protein
MRYKLRTLIVLTTMLAGLFASLGKRYARVSHLESVVSSLNATGARVRRDWQSRTWLDKNLSWLPHSYTPIGDVQAGNVRTFGDDELTLVLSLPELSVLELQNTNVTDEGLRRVAEASMLNLRSINLANTGLTDKGLAHLASLPGLTDVVVSGCDKLTIEGVERFRRNCGQFVRLHGLP